MSPGSDRWHEIDALFDAALALPPDDRAGFLADSCGDDEELLQAVERLLATQPHSDSFWNAEGGEIRNRVAMGLGAEMKSTQKEPDQIGPYRLVRRIGRGGMGSVYLAERVDGQFEQEVAIKLLRRDLDTQEILRRFLAERQILASLQHPNIARLLDGGTSDEGRPYFVMEHVEGLPIDQYCDAHRLSIEDRLSLFAVVLEAVRQAHRRPVIHRDIKPANILVTEDGTPKLLDFGIAKAVDAGPGNELTRTGVRLMTPGYASPEQVAGEPVTTASDIFQLGVLLYQLLTGERPFGGSETTTHELERRTLASEFELPSRRMVGVSDDSEGVGPVERAAARDTDPVRLGRTLSGDLDDITAKALRREPDLRYGSVDQFLDDLERRRTGQPVAASTGATRYRLHKFARRNRAALVMAGIVLTLGVGYIVTLTVQSERLAEQRDRAQIEAERATMVTDFVVGLFEVSDPDQSQGETVTARELLEAGASRVSGELAGQPRMQATMWATLGEVYFKLGLHARARPLLDSALASLDPSVDDEAAESARVADVVGDILLHTDTDSALAVYEGARELAERSLGPRDPLVATLMVDWAFTNSRSRDQDLPRIIATFDTAISILRDAPGDNRQELARALRMSAYGRPPDESIPKMEESLRLSREMHGDLHSSISEALNDLSLTMEPFDPLGADTLMERAVEIQLQLVGERHPTTLSLMNNLAGLRRDRGAYAEAEPIYRRVLEIRRETYPDDDWSIGRAAYGLGIVLSELGSGVEAEASLRESRVLHVKNLGEDHVLVPLIDAAIGRCLAVQGRYEEAEEVLLGAIPLILAADLQSFDKVKALERLVRLYEDWGRSSDAARYQAQIQSLADSTGLRLDGGG